MNKRRLMALLERRIARRVLIAPVVVVAAVLAVVLSPALLVGAIAADVVTRRRRWPTVRLGVMILGALVIEATGTIAALVLWVITGFGLLGRSRWQPFLHRNYIGWYSAAMVSLISRVIGAPLQWGENADLSSGPVVVLARHTSFFDALVPAMLVARRNKLLPHHVATQGLRLMPCLDIVGHRFPNRFIARSPGKGSSELVHIEAVGAALDEQGAAIIFPEGTFRDNSRFERVLRRMRRRQPELAERAATLTHVLPPRTNGSFALVSGAPDADVVICANTGFEPFGTLKAIVDAPFTNRPIVIESWRVNRSEVPADFDEFGLWLFDQFEQVDAWVDTWVDRTQAATTR